MLKLQITDPDGDSKILDFEDFPLRIGREKDSEIVTDDSMTSRLHASIESEDGRLCLRDEGSANGCFLNSTRVERGELSPGDRIRIGKSWLEVLEIDGREATPVPSAGETSPAGDEEIVPAGDEEVVLPGDEEAVLPGDEESSAPETEEAPGKERELPASLARRRKAALFGPVIVLLLCGLGGYWLFTGYINRERPAVQRTATQVRHDQARAQIRKFIEESSYLESITPGFLNRIAAAKIEYSEVKFRSGETSFNGLDQLVRQRRQLDVNNRLYALVSLKERLLSEHAWQRLFAVIDREGAAIIEMDPSVDDKIFQLRKICTDAAAEEFRKLANYVDYLEGIGQPGEALDTIAYGQKLFRGTEYAAQFAGILTLVRDRVTKKIEEEKALLAQRRKTLLKKSPALARVEEKPLSQAERLTVMLKSSLGAFELAGSADEIDPVRLVALSGQKLSGKDLLFAARFAFNSMLSKEAGELILKYLGKEREKECVADTAAARLLADARGLDKVPEGGFAYTRGYGWEDAGDKTQRLALVASGKILRKFYLVKSEKKLNDYFDQLIAVMSKPGLPAAGRELIRVDTIESLGKLREKTSRGLERMVKHTAFARLKKAREELDKRRAEAVRIIYDSKIYLPESHPDWPDGDEVNGQKEVDAAVDSVRELWNSAASFAIRLDKSTNAMSELIKTIEEKCYTELKYNPGEGTEGGLQELSNNLDRKIDLKSFALDRSDLGVYNYNRKVEAYNKSLKSEDVSETDKQHAVVVNDYREMMGRSRLFLDERLCRATRKHSMVCNAAGKIWHRGSDGSPGSRAKAEGFPKGVGENIAIGYSNPEDTWTRGWYRASDHHRNGLGERWTCLGYGYAGRVGTQNFSAIAAPFK